MNRPAAPAVAASTPPTIDDFTAAGRNAFSKSSGVLRNSWSDSGF
jgi:hypothetical protein